MIKKVNAIEVKTIFLGEAGVGKTSLIKAAIDEKFDANEKTTGTSSFIEKSIKIDKNYWPRKI